jgi:hypothetical protein
MEGRATASSADAPELPTRDYLDDGESISCERLKALAKQQAQPADSPAPHGGPHFRETARSDATPNPCDLAQTAL